MAEPPTVAVVTATRLTSGSAPPTLLDALLPIVVLIALLALTIALFGIDATNGPLQVALLLSAAFASLIAFKNGYTVAGVADAAVGGVTSAIGAIFILLAVGALIGTWNMAGTIPTVVDYGIRLVSPTWFYLTAAVVCALVGMVTGSSWTTAGTLGVAFVGMAQGDGPRRGHRRRRGHLRRLLRRQDDAAVGDDDPGPQARRRRADRGRAHPQHVLDRGSRARHQPGHLHRPRAERGPGRRDQHRRGPRRRWREAFNISLGQPAPAAAAGACSRSCRFPPFLSILGSALFAGILAPFTQWDAVKAFVDDPSLGPVATSHQGHLRGDGDRVRQQLRVSSRSTTLFTRGGMASLLTTIWLVLGALSFAAVMEHAGFLQRLLLPIVSRTRRRGSLIAAVNSSGIGLNVIAGDQYVADVLPARMFRGEFPSAGWLRRCCPGPSRTPAR